MFDNAVTTENEAEKSHVARFYINKSALITGGSGFLGKILIEKLLRSCPGLKQIFVLMRPKRNKQPEERFQELFKEPLFDLVRNDEHLLQKVVMVEGDVTRKNLGLKEEDSNRITTEVSIIFNVAATVRFNEPLKEAVNVNLVGTKNVIELSRKLARLAALVHVSTAYANCDRNEVDEHVYPVNMDPDSLIEVANLLDQDTLEELKFKLLADRPNTYTYTKALAEWLLVKRVRDLPVVICRPSIITSCWKEPFKGWIDNVNGATGVYLDMCRGILRSMLGEPSCVVDLIPADTVTNLIICSAWFVQVYQNHKLLDKCNLNEEQLSSIESLTGQQIVEAKDINDGYEKLIAPVGILSDDLDKRGLAVIRENGSMKRQIEDGSNDCGYASARESPENLSKSDAVLSCVGGENYDEKLSKFRSRNKLKLKARNLSEEIADVPVFHCTSGGKNPITWDKFTSLFIAAFITFPSMAIYRYPAKFYSSNKRLNSFYRATLHYLPAYIMDFITPLFGGKAKFVRMCKRLDSGEEIYKPFTSNQWEFGTENISMLRNEMMTTVDKRVFDFDINDLNWSDYITDYVLGMKKYLLKEPLDNLDKARRNLNFVYYRNSCLQIIFVSLLVGLVQYIK